MFKVTIKTLERRQWCCYGVFIVDFKHISRLYPFSSFCCWLFKSIIIIFVNLLPLKSIYLLKVNNRNIRKRCEICSKLTIKTLERRQWRCSGVFIVNLNIFHILSRVSIVDRWTSKCLLWYFSEAAVPRYSIKQLFWKSSQNSQEKSCTKTRTPFQVFSCEFYDFFEDNFLIECIRVSNSDCYL